MKGDNEVSPISLWVGLVLMCVTGTDASLHGAWFASIISMIFGLLIVCCIFNVGGKEK
jgi:hypothetical protein